MLNTYRSDTFAENSSNDLVIRVPHHNDASNVAYFDVRSDLVNTMCPLIRQKYTLFPHVIIAFHTIILREQN